MADSSRLSHLAGRGRQPKPPPEYRLSFLLPAAYQPVEPGRHQPADGGPILDIDLTGLIHIIGRSRGEVFAHAATFLRRAGRGRGPETLVATLQWPKGTYHPDHAHRDHWSFAVGADVSWAPTALGQEVAGA